MTSPLLGHDVWLRFRIEESLSAKLAAIPGEAKVRDAFYLTVSLYGPAVE